jgi:hypothetical protein
MSNNPFEWYKRTEPSIFATDSAFTFKSNGKTGSQMASELVNEQRKQGKSPGTIHGLSSKGESTIARSKLMVALPKDGPKGSGGDRKTTKSTTAKRG